MSRIAELRQLEAQIAEHQARLESLKINGKLKKEIDFEEKLRASLGEHGMSLKDVIAVLDPDRRASARQPAANEKRTRRERVQKRYKHPETGEIIETKGGNHKVLKAWKAEHGAETVEGWLQ
ncbi:histone-like nucleoid-structuring protein, MvaT/MvaU family [Pseudomonas oryzihabitans]|uniref:histone-like nucleoid-structuring protein, MvaT/MvaU family n=1 Tax=Pseudomonas oryzihabitans TaxID=47885 RepID=UPI0009E56274|nr:histone-like nucleoid-structuring protein, MvaT/MvaU family [Pseudomonas oryzihabitans]